MAISKIVDNRSYSNKPDDSASCMKGSSDCQYLTESGGCSAEWCIYEELPKMINSSRELTCSICGKNKKSFSSYSGVRSYICDECNKKIKKITPDKKLCAICNTNEVELDQCICTSCQKDILSVIKNNTCPICGRSTKPGQYICTTCSAQIKEKLDE